MAEQILIISPVQVFPAFSGNCKRIHSVCTELMRAGYVLDFFYTGFDSSLHEEHRDFFNGRILEHRVESVTLDTEMRRAELINGLKIRLQKMGRLIKDGALSARYNRGLAEYRNVRKRELLKREATSNYRAVIINYAVYSHYFDLFSSECRKILDTHDRLSDRYKLFLNQGDVPPNWHSLRRRDEKQALGKADTIWAITDNEADFFRSLIDEEPERVTTVRHLIPCQPVEKQSEGSTLLFAGSHNRLNRDGISWFLREVWPKLLRTSNHPRLLIAGTICDVLNARDIPEGVELYGRFDTDDEIYSLTDLCINPMQAGTGLKIKTMEALAAGKAVISTTHGAAGLEEFISSGIICSDDAGVWVEKIQHFFRDADYRKTLCEGAQAKVQEIYQMNRNRLLESVKA